MPYKRGVFSNPSTAAAVPIYMNNPPTSHSAEHWDTASILPLPTVASVSAGVALTTSQCYEFLAVLRPGPYLRCVRDLHRH